MNINTSTHPNISTLPVMEDFYTIQGEGFYQGHAAYFIRLGGCDVGCVWCDVKESWDADAHPKIEIGEIVKKAKSSGTEIAVVTGGEPAMYNLDLLTTELQAAGLKTNIETSGAYPLTGSWDWVCLSPKKKVVFGPASRREAWEQAAKLYNANPGPGKGIELMEVFG